MAYIANVVLLSCVAAIGHGLVITHSFGGTPERKSVKSNEAAGNHDMPASVLKPANRGTPDMVEKESPPSNHSVMSSHESYYNCSGDHCNVNTTKMKAELQSGLILFLGCSLDIYAIKHFCNSAQATLVGFENNFAYMAHCTMAAFTLVYVFQPGATAPPYWKDYVGVATSQQIIAQSALDVVTMFGREPSAIVVDASLWDVSSWWQRFNMPPEPYAVPEADIARWCNTDVPQLLSWVATAYPRTPIAFRTPPPVFPNNGYGQQPAIVDTMVTCMASKRDVLTNKVYAKYDLIDYHGLVQQFFLHNPGPPLQFYADVLHPGQRLSMVYMNAVLEWVRSFAPMPPR